MLQQIVYIVGSSIMRHTRHNVVTNCLDRKNDWKKLTFNIKTDMTHYCSYYGIATMKTTVWPAYCSGRQMKGSGGLGSSSSPRTFVFGFNGWLKSTNVSSSPGVVSTSMTTPLRTLAMIGW